MRTPSFIKVLCQRGTRRQAAILDLLNRTPGREYNEQSICRLLRDWSGVIHPALIALTRSGHIIQTTDGYGRHYYRSRRVGEGAGDEAQS